MTLGAFIAPVASNKNIQCSLFRCRICKSALEVATADHHVISVGCVHNFCVPSTDKTIKLWKISERCRRYSNLNTQTDEGQLRKDRKVTELKVPVKVMDDVSIEAMPRRIFSNGHTYHINSISVNSDDCTYLSADDLRVNLWDLERTDQSFSILPHSMYTCVCMWLACCGWLPTSLGAHNFCLECPFCEN